jgi:hypothetical protein
MTKRTALQPILEEVLDVAILSGRTISSFKLAYRNTCVIYRGT